MKGINIKSILIKMLLICLFYCIGVQLSHLQEKEEELKGKITISGAGALYPIVSKWAEEFQRLHAKVKIDVSLEGTGKGISNALDGVVDLAMVSREIYPEEISKGAWWVSVTKDGVVATINENNPFLEDILSKGIKREVFIGIWITEEIKTWGEVIGRNVPHKIHVYTRADDCGAAETWAKFLGKNQKHLMCPKVYYDLGIAEAVKKDALGIGYNNICYAYDSKTKREIKGLRVVPIDFNGNDRIDENEDFYSNRDEIAKAIATGKYPSPPARELHFVSLGKPKKKPVVEFIKWVLTYGQRYVAETGYIKLNKERIQEGLRKLK